MKCSLYAIKVPARPDAMIVFNQEARMLTKLQQSRDASEHIVPFYGLDLRSSSLVFEGVVGGSLENLVSRLRVMTEWARHPEVVTLFPKLAYDMVSGLRFIHDAGVVHADIKPSNVLLDISEGINPSNFVIRARYIDFSAAFSVHDGSSLDSGGTWSFMAPEQLRRGDLNTPTFASDIWSVGVSLLYILVGASPYAYVCGDNVFRLREAIKTGDPIGFARMDDTVRQRLDASQDFVDCCRLALQKDPSRRATASAWLHWLGIHDTGY